MTSVLIEQMVANHAYPVVNADTVYPPESHLRCVFFSGDPARVKEADDVAVILPELAKAFSGRFEPALAERAAERELQAQFGFRAYPALVFLDGTRCIGHISRVQDWADYLVQISDIIERRETAQPELIPVSQTTH